MLTVTLLMLTMSNTGFTWFKRSNIPGYWVPKPYNGHGWVKVHQIMKKTMKRLLNLMAYVESDEYFNDGAEYTNRCVKFQT